MLLSEQEYSHAVDILAGRTDREPLLQEFEEWFEETFGLKVYDYICDVTKAGRVRLKVVLWDKDCRKKLMKGANPDFRKQKKIGEKFSELCRTYRKHEAYYRADGLLVCYDTLQDEIGKRILKQAESRIKAAAEQDRRAGAFSTGRGEAAARYISGGRRAGAGVSADGKDRSGNGHPYNGRMCRDKFGDGSQHIPGFSGASCHGKIYHGGGRCS